MSAQDSIPLGTRVRVTIGPERREIIGALTRADPVVWVLRLNDRGDSAVVPRADLTEVRVSRGMRRNVLEGFAIGVLLGGAFGAAIHQPSPGSCNSPACASFHDLELATAIAGGVLGGGLLGAVIGAADKTEHWKWVNPERAQVTIRPSKRGVGVAISLRF